MTDETQTRREPSGGEMVAGAFGFGLLLLVGYGLWVGAESLWTEVIESTPTHVECHADGREVYSGLTTDGVSGGGLWGKKTMTDYVTNQKIRIDHSATCVERELTKPELRELSGR